MQEWIRLITGAWHRARRDGPHCSMGTAHQHSVGGPAGLRARGDSRSSTQGADLCGSGVDPAGTVHAALAGLQEQLQRQGATTQR